MDVKGIMTMRLHRLHFNSRLWPRTLAMSCPHSHRVSCASGIVNDLDMISLILRTIIKIVRSVDDGPLDCQEGGQQVSGIGAWVFSAGDAV